MAFNPKNLNNIAGSIGKSNIWIYTDTTIPVTDLDDNDFFIGANKYGMSVGDLIFLVGENGAAMFGRIDIISDTASQLATVDDVSP